MIQQHVFNTPATTRSTANFLTRRVCTLILATAALTSVARADQAVVVGINEYPNLPGANLNGCVNDSANMDTTLTAIGFKVTRLNNDKATKQGILDALSAVKNNIQPTERFVFYFAGHGTKHTDGRGALVVNDSGKEEAKDLKADELFPQLKDIKGRAKSVSVIMDSCFSGAMSRFVPGRTARKVRYLRRSRANAKDFVITSANSDTKIEQEPVNNQDNTNQWDSGGKEGICYFTAATGSQVAEENEFDGKPSGIFTYFLNAHLTTIAPQLAANKRTTTRNTRALPRNDAAFSWFDTQTKVSGQVAKQTDGLQQPTVSRLFHNALLFESIDDTGGTPPPAPQPQRHEVWDLYNSNKADSDIVSLQMTPNKAPVKVGEKFRFDVNVGSNGYLVVLESAASGKINMIFPMSGKLEDAQVKEGQTVSIPPQKDKMITNDRPGTESVKAILFTSEDPAANLLRKFTVGEGGAFPTLRTERQRDFITVSANEWYTSSITMQVVEADRIAEP